MQESLSQQLSAIRAAKEAQAKADRIRIGTELKAQREACHYNLAVAATKANIKEVTLHNIEQGKFSADIDLLSKIASNYGCKYSKIPTFESPFKKGDMVWYIDYGAYPMYEKVRTVIWRGSYYEYQCGRKQHSYKAYATKEECNRELAKINIENAIARISKAANLVGGVESLKALLKENNLKLIE